MPGRPHLARGRARAAAAGRGGSGCHRGPARRASPRAALRALVRKRCRTDIAVAERDEWERWYEARRAEAAALAGRIADAEAEIDDRVYRLFGLDRDEVAAVEEALAGQY